MKVSIEKRKRSLPSPATSSEAWEGVSLFTQLGEHHSPIHAGVTLIPMVIGMVVGMGASFALVKRLGRRLIQIGVTMD
jgi:hypothetical protein